MVASFVALEQNLSLQCCSCLHVIRLQAHVAFPTSWSKFPVFFFSLSFFNMESNLLPWSQLLALYLFNYPWWLILNSDNFWTLGGLPKTALNLTTAGVHDGCHLCVLLQASVCWSVAEPVNRNNPCLLLVCTSCLYRAIFLEGINTSDYIMNS